MPTKILDYPEVSLADYEGSPQAVRYNDLMVVLETYDEVGADEIDLQLDYETELKRLVEA
jgi:hypothetical protein